MRDTLASLQEMGRVTSHVRTGISALENAPPNAELFGSDSSTIDKIIILPYNLCQNHVYTKG
jgi:hypothetical protein